MKRVPQEARIGPRVGLVEAVAVEAAWRTPALQVVVGAVEAGAVAVGEMTGMLSVTPGHSAAQAVSAQSSLDLECLISPPCRASKDDDIGKRDQDDRGASLTIDCGNFDDRVGKDPLPRLADDDPG